MSQNPDLPLPNHQDNPSHQKQFYSSGLPPIAKGPQQSLFTSPKTVDTSVNQNQYHANQVSNGPTKALQQNDLLQQSPRMTQQQHFLSNNAHLNNLSQNSSRNASPILNNPAVLPYSQQQLGPQVTNSNRIIPPPKNTLPQYKQPVPQNFPPKFQPAQPQTNTLNQSHISPIPPPSAIPQFEQPVSQNLPLTFTPAQPLPFNQPQSGPTASGQGYSLPQRQINANMPPLVPSSQPPHFLQQNVNNSIVSQNPSVKPPLIPTSSAPSSNAMLPPSSSFVGNSMIPPPLNSQPHYPPTNQHQYQPPVQNLSKTQYPQSTPQQYPQQFQPPNIPQYPQAQNFPPQSQPPNIPQYPQPQNFPPSIQNQTQFNSQQLDQQMGRLSVTNSGFNQLWGHQAFDLLQCRHILPPDRVEPPEIKLGQLFAQAANCSPDVFRCTVTKMPETNNLLQKSRLPLGILIHPFRDLYNLPVIQCNSIVRCRSCRTYINPFVYFVDSKRWKCNLCYRVNDLPDDFQYDPVSHSYGDPTKRPEIKSATIEFIAPSEYMLRPPPPAVYIFLMDVSYIARESGYLQIVCDTLLAQLEQLPGDSRKQIGFICYDSALHFYCLGEGLTRPRELTVLDIDDMFLPMPDSLLVNLGEQKSLVEDILRELPKRHQPNPAAPHASALGAALQAAYKLMAPTGGRVTVFQTCLPNVGPGSLTSREDPNARSGKEVQHLNPATDFYKRLALDCSGSQIAVDLFLLNSQFSDLSTLSGISKFCGGTVHHIPLFKASRPAQAQQLKRILFRYLTRKIGFEAVMRIRCTRGITIHTFHGNFFVRSTDLLALPNVSPDSGFGMQLAIEESLADLQQVCFQAALLYTSSKGERRIRVHTMCLPICNTLVDILNSADQQCIIGLLSKMAVDRSVSASLSDAREALTNVAVDSLGAYKLASGASASPGLPSPKSLALLPLYLHSLLRHPAFRTGQSTRLDDRVSAMCAMKSLPLYQLMRSVYPDLYPIHNLQEYLPKIQQERNTEDQEEQWPDPPRFHLSAERVNSNGVYLLDDGELMTIYIGHNVDTVYLKETFGVNNLQEIPEDWRELPEIETEHNQILHAFVDKLNDDRPYASEVLIVKDTSPNRTVFTERLLDDRVESALSYYEFLQHIKSQIK